MQSNKPLKIAIYTGTIPSSTFIEHLIRGLADYHQILLFGTIKKKIDYKNPNIHIIETPTVQYKNIVLTGFRSIRLLFKSPRLLNIAFNEAKKYSSNYEKWMRFSRFVPVLIHQPDIFNVQWAKKISRWMFLQEAYGCKLVLSLRGTHMTISPISIPGLAKSYTDNFPKIDGFHAVSESLKLKAIKYSASEKKIKTIHTILPNSLTPLYSKPKSFGNTIKLVSVGRHHWVKGYNYALKAMKLLKDKGVDVSYTIIAPKPIPEQLIYMVNDMGISQQIVFKDHIAQDELFPFLQTFNVFLLPSLSEGIANVVLEAMALGLPVVSTDCGGMPEVVIPGQTGWLVPVRNPEAMAKAITEVSKTPLPDLENLCKQAREFVKQKFDQQTSIAEFLKFYADIMDN